MGGDVVSRYRNNNFGLKKTPLNCKNVVAQIKNSFTQIVFERMADVSSAFPPFSILEAQFFFFFLPSKDGVGPTVPLKVSLHTQPRNTKCWLKYKHRALFSLTTLAVGWDSVVSLCERKQRRPSGKKKKWNWIKAFVCDSMLRGISNSCRHLKALSC